jgi:ADP-ribose pyrophosphatase
MTGFRVTSSTQVAKAGFLSIDELAIEAPDGEQAKRVVVRHPGAVVVVPVSADRATAVLVRQYRAASGTELLEVPAGKRDVDGEAPELTAARELEEETGFTPGRLVKLAEFFNTPGFSDEYTHLFVALELAPCETHATSVEEKHMVTEEVAFAQLDTLIAQRRLIDAKSIIGLLLARAYLAGEYPGLDSRP